MDTTRLAGDVSGRPGRASERSHLVERILPRVRRYFARLAGQADADDLVQETLLRLEASLTSGEFEAGRSYNAWVWLKARSVWVDALRRKGRRPTRSLELHEATDAPDSASASSDRRRGRSAPDLDARLDAETLLAALRARVGEEVFHTFVLYHEAELTQDEVALAAGCDPKTVRRRLRLAEESLATLRSA